MRVIMLLGPSTAGKSSICSELKATYGCQILSGDDLDLTEKTRKDTQTAIDRLKASGLIPALSSYMTEEEVIKLCIAGKLTISKGDYLITTKFDNPNFPDIDKILRQATFPEDVIVKLTKNLRDVGQVFKSSNRTIYQAIFDETFSGKFVADETIILDLVPPGKGMGFDFTIEDMLDDFNKHITQYNNEHKDNPVSTYIALAHCSPLVLRERLSRRITQAEIDGNLRNKRPGIFPLLQLSSIVEVDPKADPSQYGAISISDLRKIAATHPEPIRKDNAKITSKKVVSSHSRWRGLTEAALKADRKAEFSSIKMAKHFGIWQKGVDLPADDATLPLRLRDGIKVDICLDTATKDSATLAKQLIEATQAKLPDKPSISVPIIR